MVKLIKYGFVLVGFILAISVNAQVYPVGGNAVLVPPYSVYLADYTSPTSDRLIANLVLNDVTRPELRVRLRIKITGQNIALETKPEYIGREIVLEGGVPTRLTGVDLAEYFNPNNLNFSGITKRTFEQTGALPQGFYQFCVEVLEYNRGVKISNTICAPGWLILNDPPIINLPRNGEKLRPLQPQNVVFQWTPRHTGSPNSAFSTEYDVKLVEIWPSNRNPNDAILTSPPILEETTRSTTFIYDISQTPLEAGRHYALQVKAKSIVGADELDLFKNNGKSEVISFVYGDPCDAPVNITAQATSPTRFTVNWLGNNNHTGYKVEYRQSGTTNWYSSTSLTPDIGIGALKPNTQYEYRVAGTCGYFESVFSTAGLVTTKSSDDTGYACGLPLEPFSLDPSQLMDVLKVGDVIDAGDFEVVLAKVSGSGTFSGEGVIEMPFFNKARVKAEFSGIQVNKDMRMVSGHMNVTGAAVEVIPAGVMDFMDNLSEVLTGLDTMLTNLENNLPKPFDPNAFVPETTLTLPGPVIITKAPDGSVVITDNTGKTHTLPKGTEAAVIDDKGNATFVDKTGTTHSVPLSTAQAAANREYNLKLNFTETQTQLYGFDDAYRYAELKGRYEHEKLINDYYVPYKSVETGKTDPVTATLAAGSIDKSKIRFEAGGIPVTTTPFSNNQTTVTARATGNGEQEAIIAIYSPADTAKKDQVLGRVNVVTYNAINKRLVIVPVNDNEYKLGTAPTLQTAINKIYSQAVVNWAVEIKPGITVENISPFNTGESGLLSNYTNHMKDVIRVYKDNMENDDNTYYLFLVNNPSDPKIAGVMPRSKNAGFIFYDKHSSETDMARTMAHELGHGAFNLHHTFMEENFRVQRETTDNLMDYTGGTKLYKYQWDMMRYPPIVMGVFESDEEAESAIVVKIPPELVSADGRTATFVSPAGTLVIVPSLSTDLQFSYGFNTLDEDFIIPGTLLSFRVGNETFASSKTLRDGIFDGYSNVESNKKYSPYDKFSNEVINNGVTSAILMLACGDGRVSLSKFQVSDMVIEKGETSEFKTLNNFPIKPYSTNQLIAEKEFEHSELPDLFDLDDHRQKFSQSVFNFLKYDCKKETLLPKLKVSEYYALNPILFSKFYEPYVTNNDPEFWVSSIDRFKEYLHNSNKTLSEYLNDLSLDTNSDQWEKIFMLMGPNDYLNLTYDQRILLLELSTKFISYGLGDKWVRNLVVLIKDEEKKRLLDDLIVVKNSLSNHSLLGKILTDFKGVDGDEFTQLVSALVERIFEFYPPSENFNYKVAFEEKKFISFDPNFWVGDFVTQNFNEKGQIVLKTNFGDGLTVEAQPFEYIIIESYRDHQISGAQLKGGAKLKMPALYAYLVFNNLNTQRLFKAGRLTIDVAFLAVGVGELNLAIKAGNAFRLTRALADMGVGLSDITFNHGIDQYLMKSEAGREFLDAWGNIMMAYGILRIGDEFFNAQMTRLENNLSIIKQEDNLTSSQLNEITTSKKSLGTKLNIISPEDFVGALSPNLREIHDQLMLLKAGVEVKANSLIYKNSKNETVAIIYNGKFTPTKWAWQKNFSSSQKKVTSEGYIIINDGSDIKFDLGFKEGGKRNLESKEVNDYLVNGQGKDLDGQPYWAGTKVEEMILGEEGELIYFIEDNIKRGNSVPAPNPGQYGSKDPISTVKELRDKLAVKEAWKATSANPTLRVYRIKSVLRVRSGIIGPQTENGVLLQGGWHQYEVIDYLGDNWNTYLEFIEEKELIKN